MNHSKKLVFNTIASYLYIIVNTIVTMISTRIALKCLGADDFGLYNLIAGVVLMLSFFNGSLMISSQRYFSIAIGEKNKEKIERYFNSSLGIHFAISIIVGVLLVIMIPFLFNGFLNIPDGKKTIAVVVYLIMALSSITTIATIPYSAIINAREDLAVLALIDIFYCVGKLVAAIILLFITNHLLECYSVIMFLAVLLKMVLEVVWSNKSYSETKLKRNLLYDRDIYKEMLGFVGWNTLGSVAVIFRNQGVAVVLNVFFGTAVNAAYGIANQVNSMVLSFASTLSSVFTPMIIQAKGAGNEKKMISSALLSSKLSFLLSTIMALPILTFMKEILQIWLVSSPQYTTSFCELIVCAFLIQQLYPGINRAIYATGEIKGYQISLSILLIAIIPIGAALFYMGLPPTSIMYVMIVSQAFTLFATVYFAWKYCKLNVIYYLINSVLRPSALFIVSFIVSVFIKLRFINNNTIMVMIFSSCIMVTIYSIIYFFAVFNNEERFGLIGVVKQFLKKKYA